RACAEYDHQKTRVAAHKAQSRNEKEEREKWQNAGIGKGACEADGRACGGIQRRGGKSTCQTTYTARRKKYQNDCRRVEHHNRQCRANWVTARCRQTR